MRIDLEGLVGIPYLFHGRDPDMGLDCLGLVIETFDRCGYVFPDPLETYPDGSPGDLINENLPDAWTPAYEPYRLLDVIFIRSIHRQIPEHIGVYVGRGRVLHMPNKRPSELVSLQQVRRLRESAWRLPELEQ